jgi:hypothetical protein
MSTCQRQRTQERVNEHEEEWKDLTPPENRCASRTSLKQSENAETKDDEYTYGAGRLRGLEASLVCGTSTNNRNKAFLKTQEEHMRNARIILDERSTGQ